MRNRFFLKSLVCFLLFLLFTDLGISQENYDSIASKGILLQDDSIKMKSIERRFTIPRFPGCENIEVDAQREECAIDKMYDFIYSKLSYPKKAKKNGITDQVILKFGITEEGLIEKVEILRDPGYGLGESAKEAVLSMNDMTEKWIPAFKNGIKVYFWYTMPIKFPFQKPSK